MSENTFWSLGFGALLVGAVAAGVAVEYPPLLQPPRMADGASSPSNVGAPGPEVPELDGGWQKVSTENEPVARHENAFIEVDGKFYLLGGRGDRPVNVYDPATNRWAEGAAPPFQLHHFQAVAHGGLIYVIAAFSDDYPRENGISFVQIYDPDADEWRRGPEIPVTRRRGAAGAVVYDGQIYIVGGLVGGHGPQANAVDWLDVFDPETGQWRALTDKPAPRVRDHFQAAVVNDKMYLVGGRNTGVPGFIDSTIAAVDVYDFETERWSTLDEAPVPTERAGSTTIAYGDHVIITGGEGFGQTWGQTEALNTRTGQWELIGNLQQSRHGTQAFLYDGRLYIAAGSGGQGGGPELTSMERFVFD